jgi:formylglycine-generating enzyme required for sulfatase activity
MRADEVLEPSERAEAGDTLARLGDPRFRKDAWYLPDERLLGFVEIPEGPFVMGEGEDQHELIVSTYHIARCPVTVAQFRAFVEDSGDEPRDWLSLQRVDNHPVRNVTWHDAREYCNWLTSKLLEWEETPEPLATLLQYEGWVVTLPSEAEWEKAARGIDGRAFPWGDEADPNLANYAETGIGTTSAVGCFPGGASPYRVEDLSGNVWEWTRSDQADDPYVPRGGQEILGARGFVLPVLRGGSFIYSSSGIRCAVRIWDSPSVQYRSFGFRVVLAP